MPLTTYGRQKLGDHSIGKTAFTMPSVFAGLFTASPGDAGSQASEFTGGGYARQTLPASFGNFHANGPPAPPADISFPTPAADWGTLAYVGILDAVSAGNMIYYDAVPVARPVVNGGRRVTLRAGLFRVALV